MAVILPSIVIPGHFFADEEGTETDREHLDRESFVKSAVDFCTTQLIRAAYSLHHMQAIHAKWEAGLERSAWFERHALSKQRRRDIEVAAKAAEIKLDGLDIDREELNVFERDGKWPWPVEISMGKMFAEAHVCALHQIKSCIAIAHREYGCETDRFKTELDAFDAFFPDLRLVRNTIQHMEERLLGYRKDKDSGEKVPHIAVFGRFGRDTYETTVLDRLTPKQTNDGRDVVVVVSLEGIEVARALVQAFVNSFDWQPKRPHCSMQTV